MDLSRILGLIGLLSIVSVWITIFTAIALSSCFDWRANALSDLGDWGTACKGDIECLRLCNRLSEPVFNCGLIVFGSLLTIASIGLTRKAGIYSYTLTGASIFMVLIGLLPERYSPYHYIVSVTFFTLLLLSIIIYVITGERNEKILGSILLVMGSLGFIVYILLANNIISGLGVAVPEVMMSLPGSLWGAMVFYKRMYKE